MHFLFAFQPAQKRLAEWCLTGGNVFVILSKCCWALMRLCFRRVPKQGPNKSLLIYLIIPYLGFSSFVLDDNNAKAQENVTQNISFSRKQVFYYFCEVVPTLNEDSCWEIKHFATYLLYKKWELPMRSGQIRESF